jgi:hypothetical protein
MECLYYLAPTLDSTQTISDDLHAVGVNDWYLHVISKDEAGLRKERIHSSNYIETMDFMRAGFVGAWLGFIVGMIGALLLMATKPFGPETSGFIYLVVVIFTTLFGAWEGGLYGVATENRKLAQFHDEIESGKYLFLIYARKRQRDTVRAMMRVRHPESALVGTDEHFISPFSIPCQ